MAADLLIYIIIVLALLVWLRNTMGTRHEDEPQRPNPLSGAEGSESTGQSSAQSALSNSEDSSESDQASKHAAARDVEIADSGVERGLSEIAARDKGFDLKSFLSAAQDAFVIIVEAFAKGDKQTLEPLLDKDVYKAFEQEIDARKQRGEVQETEIQAVRNIEITQAVLKDKMAYISLRITAEEVSYTKDEEGEIIAGNPDRIYDMTDLWTFGRNIKSKDPVWYLYETRDDQQEDHDSVSIPEAGEKDNS